MRQQIPNPPECWNWILFLTQLHMTLHFCNWPMNSVLLELDSSETGVPPEPVSVTQFPYLLRLPDANHRTSCFSRTLFCPWCCSYLRYVGSSRALLQGQLQGKALQRLDGGRKWQDTRNHLLAVSWHQSCLGELVTPEDHLEFWHFSCLLHVSLFLA
jgi:hypothetical protein